MKEVINYREKIFSKSSNKAIKKVISFIKKFPIVPISTASLGLGVANYSFNKKKYKEDEAFREKQLDAMKELTEELSKNTIVQKERNKNNKKMIKFKQKGYSDNIISNSLSGLKIGAGIGTTLAGVLKFSSSDEVKKINPLIVVGSGALYGAALGAITGIIKDYTVSSSRKNAGIRLFDDVIKDLRGKGFKEGSDFTQDPRLANIIKTKVCIVVSRRSTGLKILINTINDPDLVKVTNRVHESLGKSVLTTEKVNNKFNELTISTLSSNNGDSNFVARIIETFIRNGYPVYIVEVG